MINKILNYCWFGKKEKPRLVKKCIKSWKKYLPDYEIIEWNENNFNVYQNEYVAKAYEAKKWAFVSDYARLKILHDTGGVYVDTDVEFIKHLPDEILTKNAFTGIESGSLTVNPGLIFGCKPKNVLVSELLQSYGDSNFKVEKVEDMETINVRISKLLQKYGYIYKDEYQEVDGVSIFPSAYFCAYDPHTRKKKVESVTVSVHHFSGSWFSPLRKFKFQLGTLKRRIRYK